MSMLLVGLQIIFSDLSYVSGWDISSYFISFIVWIVDIGQISVNVAFIIALIIKFTFNVLFLSIVFSNPHDYQIFGYNV